MENVVKVGKDDRFNLSAGVCALLVLIRGK